MQTYAVRRGRYTSIHRVAKGRRHRGGCRRTSDIAVLAEELDVSAAAVEADLEQLADLGLIALGDISNPSPLLLNAGRQYLARDGDVPYWEVRFLATTIDDLVARAALLHAGTVVVDEFRDQILSRESVEYAVATIVPPAFASAIDDRLAIASEPHTAERLSGRRR